jgi:hypothetical protein
MECQTAQSNPLFGGEKYLSRLCYTFSSITLEGVTANNTRAAGESLLFGYGGFLCAESSQIILTSSNDIPALSCLFHKCEAYNGGALFLYHCSLACYDCDFVETMALRLTPEPIPRRIP